MDRPSRVELGAWNTQLTLDPLDPDDPRHVPLQESGRGAVDEMMATIELAVDTTTQLLSGPSGAGKTTELRRLRRDLESAGYRTVYSDITREVNESSTIDVTEFLIALAVPAPRDLVGSVRSAVARLDPVKVPGAAAASDSVLGAGSTQRAQAR